MRNERLHDGDRISLPVPVGTVTGNPVIVGGIVGVAATSRGEGGNIPTFASVWTKGVFPLSTADAVANIGDPLYITSAGVLTTTATGNTLFGRTVPRADGTGGTKAAGAGLIDVRIARG